MLPFAASNRAARNTSVRGKTLSLIASRKKHKKNVNGGHKLGEVCERELGIYLDKSLQTSDWTIRPLSADQLDYAAVDAEVLILLHRTLSPPRAPETLELF